MTKSGDMRTTKEYYKIEKQMGQVLMDILINADYSTREFTLLNKQKNQHLSSTYDDYDEIESRKFSKKRKIEMRNEMLSASLSLSFNKLKFDEPINTPFSIPDKYEVQP